MKIDKLNADNSSKIYLYKINVLLHTYALLNRVNKYQLKFNSKPRETSVLQKSISMKNKLLTSFINKNVKLITKNIYIFCPTLWKKAGLLW